MRPVIFFNTTFESDFNPLIPNGMRLNPPAFKDQLFIFQSTHPKRDETFEEKHYRSKIDGFQSTHPKRDETRRKSKSEKRRPYFNPLIPNGMRLQDCVKNIYIIIFQSTHPKRDETRSGQLKAFLDSDFNPLIPNGMRPGEKGDPGEKGEFQSTHPKRDETVQLALQVERLFISIHSSQTG